MAPVSATSSVIRTRCAEKSTRWAPAAGHRHFEPLVDARIELDVHRERVLDPERVGERTRDEEPPRAIARTISGRIRPRRRSRRASEHRRRGRPRSSPHARSQGCEPSEAGGYAGRIAAFSSTSIASMSNGSPPATRERDAVEERRRVAGDLERRDVSRAAARPAARSRTTPGGGGSRRRPPTRACGRSPRRGAAGSRSRSASRASSGSSFASSRNAASSSDSTRMLLQRALVSHREADEEIDPSPSSGRSRRGKGRSPPRGCHPSRPRSRTRRTPSRALDDLRLRGSRCSCETFGMGRILAP